MQALPAAAHSRVLSDIVAAYLRGVKHRGQLKLVHGLEIVIGRRRWNVTTIDGFRIALDLNDLVQKRIMDTGTWDPEVGDALKRRWSQNDVFFDIGANIGFFALLALKSGLARVCAFEPGRDLADLLVANGESNGATVDRLTVEPLALGPSIGFERYCPGPLENSGQGRIANDGNGIQVPMTTLDAYVEANPSRAPTVIKLDVEGLELEVLQGATNLLAKQPPHTIVFEADVTSAGEIEDRRIADLLIAAGYRIEPLNAAPLETKANFLARLTHNAPTT